MDLRENEIRIAGLMALSLALRMNHKLLHLETPKTFKVDQVREKRMRRELNIAMQYLNFLFYLARSSVNKGHISGNG